MTLRTLALSCAIVQTLAAPAALAAETAAAKDDSAATLDAVVVTAAPVSPLTFELDPRLPRQPVPVEVDSRRNAVRAQGSDALLAEFSELVRRIDVPREPSSS